MAKSKKIESFSSAMKELSDISNKIEDENTDIDAIESMILRTKELVEYCRAKLRDTEENINKIIDKM